MAISSTITGIALRVIFNQMRQDPIEVEHSARQELAEASRRVRTQLDETVLAFNHFRIQTVQSLEEAQEALLKGVLSEDGVVARVAKPIEVGAAKIGAALQDFASDINSTSGQLATKTSKVASSVTEIDNAMTTLSTRLAAMQMPDKVIEVKLEPLVDRLAAVVTEFSKYNQTHSAALTRAVDVLARRRIRRPRFRWRFWQRG